MIMEVKIVIPDWLQKEIDALETGSRKTVPVRPFLEKEKS